MASRGSTVESARQIPNSTFLLCRTFQGKTFIYDPVNDSSQWDLGPLFQSVYVPPPVVAHNPEAEHKAEVKVKVQEKVDSGEEYVDTEEEEEEEDTQEPQETQDTENDSESDPELTAAQLKDSFMALLSSHAVSPFDMWDLIVENIETDPGYTMIKTKLAKVLAESSGAERRSLFGAAGSGLSSVDDLLGEVWFVEYCRGVSSSSTADSTGSKVNVNNTKPPTDPRKAFAAAVRSWIGSSTSPDTPAKSLRFADFKRAMQDDHRWTLVASDMEREVIFKRIRASSTQP